MEIADLSLEGPGIRKYFSGDDSYIPISELLYVHTHPLVQPNFVADIERIVNSTAVYLMGRGMSGKPVERFTELAVRLGGLLPDLNRENAAEALEALRDVYLLCLKITGTPGSRKQ